MKINIKILSEDAVVPTCGSTFAAGSDLHACIDNNGCIDIGPHETMMIGTGIAMEIPEGYVGLVFARSGLACKNGLAPANKVGVIDSDYRGEIKVALHNHTDQNKKINHHDRVAQIVIVPYLSVEFNTVDELSETLRNQGGFGSSGK